LKKVLCKIAIPTSRRILLILRTEVNNVDDNISQFNLALKNWEEVNVVK